jgi:hypothetical protein
VSNFRTGLLGIALLAPLAACADGQSGGQSGSGGSGRPLVITAQTNDHLRAYMREIDSGRAGAFAVSENGEASYFSYCEHGGCNGQYNFSSLAIKGCEKFGRGRCVVLSSNGVIKRPYSVAP